MLRLIALMIVGFFSTFPISAALLGGDNIIDLKVAGMSLTGSSGASIAVPTNAVAAYVNVTVVNPTAPGFITVWPCSEARPLASNLNFATGDVNANGIIAPLDADGKACFFSSQNTDLIVDVSGYLVGSSFVGATPKRVVDSRESLGYSGTVQPDVPVEIPVWNVAVVGALGDALTIPTSANSAALNVTVVNPAAPGFVTVYPCDAARPLTSNLNFVDGQVVANGVVAAVSGDAGKVCVYASVATDIVVDLAGWFEGSQFVGTTPLRLADTRTTSRVGGVTELEVGIVNQVVSSGGTSVMVPETAVAAAINVTAVSPDSAGFVTVYPCLTTRPLASNLNYVAGDVVPNNVFATIGSNGKICVYSQAQTDIIVDIVGWLEGSSSIGYVAASPQRVVDTRSNLGLIPGLDTDGDKILDAIDTDDDNDGVLDVTDAFPFDVNEALDTDGNGIGNNADTDDDGDGVSDTGDAFPLSSAESADTDSDGTGNNADTDDDGDGVPDSSDAFPLIASESVDTDGDGFGNNVDQDDDGDLVPDNIDQFPLDGSRVGDKFGNAIFGKSKFVD